MIHAYPNWRTLQKRKEYDMKRPRLIEDLSCYQFEKPAKKETKKRKLPKSESDEDEESIDSEEIPIC